MLLRRTCFSLLAFAFAHAPLVHAADIQTLDTPRAFPQITNQSQWQERSRAIREQILVSAGLWPMPEKTPLQAKVFGKIEQDGYSVEKVYFQSYPGFYVAGNLYRPLGRGPGPFPGVLNAHGHWDHGRLEDTQLCSNPGRCINFAKQGMVAFAYDMVGYNDTHFPETDETKKFYAGHNTFASNNPAATLWGISLMGLQTWDSIRALDFLESLPDVDKSRVACTGASGGGTQTFILGAIDDRLAAQAPVVMVSHTMQGGCRCENMPGLRVKYSNMEIAAVPAPRPQILVSDTRDWTKTTMTMEGPAIEGIYQLFQGSEKLRYVQFDYEHNYNKASRQAVYQWFDHWLLSQPDQPATEQAFHKAPDEDLRVFPNGQLPYDAVSQDTLIKYIIDDHQKRLDALNGGTLFQYGEVMEPAWQHTLQLDAEELVSVVKTPVQKTDYAADQLEISRPGEDRTIKAVLFSPVKGGSAPAGVSRGAGAATVVLVHPDGGSAYIDDAGAPRGLALQLVSEGCAVVVAVDRGEPADPGQTGLLFTTYNRTRLQGRVRDIISICHGVKDIQPHAGPIVLCGSGVAGLWCLLAAPSPRVNAVAADCDQINVLDDNALMAPDLFCPGIRNIDTFQGALALASRRNMLLHNVAQNFPVEHARRGHDSASRKENLRVEFGRLNDNEIAAWIAGWRRM